MKTSLLPMRLLALSILVAIVAGLSGCGGGGGSVGVGGDLGGGTGPTPPPPPVIADPLYLASAPSPFAANCDGVAANGDTLYANSEVEPYVVANPLNTQQLVAVWQEDRWLGGGAHGIISARSPDGGKTWSLQPMLFSRCGGGNSVNGGNFARASNPWVTVGPTDVNYESAISFTGDLLAAGSTSAVLASRSIDGGATWQNPSTLISDVSNFFNDRDSITADPVAPNFVYAVWDRLAATGGGPAMLALSSDGGTTWQPARAIYDPGPTNQTISNEVVGLPSGAAVLDLFVEIDTASDGSETTTIKVLRSTDHGTTWSAPIKVADLLSIGTTDPDTGLPVRDAAIIPQMVAAPNGTLYVVFQDARFTSGNNDSISLVSSTDGGSTWTAPVRVNSQLNVPAFDPSIHVRLDGEIGVTYYDFRNDTIDPTTLPTIAWLTRSTDAKNWTENAIGGPFDLDFAPNSTVSGSPGLFLGDNQGLTSMGSVFEPLFTMTNGNINNRTDIFSAPAVSDTNFAAMARMAQSQAQPAPTVQMTERFRRRISDSISRSMESRVPGWMALVRRWHQQN